MAKFITVKNHKLLDSGTDATGTANKLTVSDTSTFEVGDIVRNTTDSTWALITAIDSSTVVSLDADIMDATENYEVYDINDYIVKPILAEGIALVEQASTTTTTITYTAGSTGADVITLTHQPITTLADEDVSVAVDAAIQEVHSTGGRPDVARAVTMPDSINVITIGIA